MLDIKCSHQSLHGPWPESLDEYKTRSIENNSKFEELSLIALRIYNVYGDVIDVGANGLGKS